MWERFSYYGMRAFLMLYMTRASGGRRPRRWPIRTPTSIYGTYTGAAWGAAIVGGLIGDRWLGQYPQRAARRRHHHAGALRARVPAAARSSTPASRSIVIGTGPPETERQHARRLALSRRRQPPRRRVLDLLHGDQPRRVARPARRRLSRAARGLAHRLRVGRASAWRSAWCSWRSEDGICRPPSIASRRSRRSRAAPPATRPGTIRRAARRRFSGAEWKRITAIVVFFLFAILFWAGLRAGRLHAEPLRRSLHAPRGVRLPVPVVVVPVGAAVLRHPAGAALRVDVGDARRESSRRSAASSRSACSSWACRFSC